MSGFVVVTVDSPERLAALRALLRRYVAEQGWDAEPHHTHEIETLPGEYAPPRGQMFVGLGGSAEPLGCAVLRPIDAWCGDCVEMRRLFVAPEARRRGIARALTLTCESWATDAGYARLRLVTMPHMVEAIQLYEHLGFALIEPYRPSTADDAVFMDKPLRSTE
jgi:GNAT superfamily N-acetyltransferase